MSKNKTEELLDEIKRLLVLQLHKAGVSSSDIGSVLNVSYKTVERMVSKKRN